MSFLISLVVANILDFKVFCSGQIRVRWHEKTKNTLDNKIFDYEEYKGIIKMANLSKGGILEAIYDH